MRRGQLDAVEASFLSQPRRVPIPCEDRMDLLRRGRTAAGLPVPGGSTERCAPSPSEVPPVAADAPKRTRMPAVPDSLTSCWALAMSGAVHLPEPGLAVYGQYAW